MSQSYLRIFAVNLLAMGIALIITLALIAAVVLSVGRHWYAILVLLVLIVVAVSYVEWKY